MAFDLGLAMRKKQEHESARPADFDFRRRVRATRLLTRSFGIDQEISPTLVARFNEEAALAHLGGIIGTTTEVVGAEYARCMAIAHQQLLAERGDPTPHRLV